MGIDYALALVQRAESDPYLAEALNEIRGIAVSAERMRCISAILEIDVTDTDEALIAMYTQALRRIDLTVISKKMLSDLRRRASRIDRGAL